jgi:hypothetical protein
VTELSSIASPPRLNTDPVSNPTTTTTPTLSHYRYECQQQSTSNSPPNPSPFPNIFSVSSHSMGHSWRQFHSLGPPSHLAGMSRHDVSQVYLLHFCNVPAKDCLEWDRFHCLAHPHDPKVRRNIVCPSGPPENNGNGGQSRSRRRRCKRGGHNHHCQHDNHVVARIIATPDGRTTQASAAWQYGMHVSRGATKAVLVDRIVDAMVHGGKQARFAARTRRDPPATTSSRSSVPLTEATAFQEQFGNLTTMSQLKIILRKKTGNTSL